MIIDQETNIVYFSSLLPKINEYKPFWKRLKPILLENNIKYDFIKKTRDIWCRDYMPIQINKTDFIQFTYFPDYYLEPKLISKLTIPSETEIRNKIKVTKSELIIDGGNIIKFKNQAIITRKVFDDNSNLLEKTIIKELKKQLKVKHIYFIPKYPYDITGHADGMIRFFDEHTILVANYSFASKSWQTKMDRALEKIELKKIPFTAVENLDKNKDGDYTAKGVYINFAQIGRYILFPQFDLKEDTDALKRIREIYKEPDYKIIPILSNEIAEDGGVLNCVTWNIKQEISKL